MKDSLARNAATARATSHWSVAPVSSPHMKAHPHGTVWNKLRPLTLHRAKPPPHSFVCKELCLSSFSGWKLQPQNSPHNRRFNPRSSPRKPLSSTRVKPPTVPMMTRWKQTLLLVMETRLTRMKAPLTWRHARTSQSQTRRLHPTRVAKQKCPSKVY